MNPEELTRVWRQVYSHLGVENAVDMLKWYREGQGLQLQVTMFRAGDRVELSEKVRMNGASVNVYQWFGLKTIFWLSGQRVSLHFEIEGWETSVVLHKDNAPVIVGAVDPVTAQAGT